jgi:hypothetical protein
MRIPRDRDVCGSYLNAGAGVPPLRRVSARTR